MKFAPWLPLPIYLQLALPFTLLAFYLLAYAPGTLLLKPFATAFGGMIRHAAALLLGWACYTFFADFTLKWLGPTAWGFYFAPGLLTWALAAAIHYFGVACPSASRGHVGENETCPREALGHATPRIFVTSKQSLFALMLGFVAVLQVVPIEGNDGIFWGTPETDWRSRLPVTNAIARDGLPAANPFFNPDGDSKLFFYYGFFLLPAACIQPLSGSGWDTVGVMAICVFLLGTMVALFAIALGNAAVGDKKGGWISGLLCYVTGLDLLPVLALTLRGTPPESLEWWNPAQITAVTAFPVWVPHHTLATLEVILAHILAWRLDLLSPKNTSPLVGEVDSTPSNRVGGADGDGADNGESKAFDPPTRRSAATSPTRGEVIVGMVVLALLLAAAAMTSTYVAMLGFFSIFIHGLLKARRLKSWREGALPMAATVLAGLMVLPFYYQLSKLDEYRGPSIQPILRPCPSEEPIRDAVVATLGFSPPFALFLTRLGGLIPQYFFELGFLFFVLIFWKRTGVGPRDPDGLWNRLGVMVVVAFVVGSIFVSVRTWNCDLNWRIMHPVQIALLGVAAAFWQDWRSKPRPLVDKIGLSFFLVIGIAGTGYDLARSRLDAFRKPGIGEKTRDALLASTWVNVSVPVTDRVAIDPRSTANVYFQHLMRRQLVISDDTFNAFPYGPDKKRVEAVAAEMAEAFSAKTSVDRRRAILHRYNVSYVLIDRNSELYGLDFKAAFGRTAFIFNNTHQDRWMVIGCATGTFK